MQSHFLSDAFFGSLRSVRFTDRSIRKNPTNTNKSSILSTPISRGRLTVLHRLNSYYKIIIHDNL
ncbi:MAG: hypothetical protein LBR79_02440 [Oscillospiraceae bacterium]|nr:hypothetical protein [Oscillospiraceae bacterium]